MSDAAQIVIDTIGGRTFRASRRTFAHLEWTADQLSRRYPGRTLRVIQGCYSTTVAASRGTHDKDACVDVEIVGMSWPDAQRFLRECGWAAWWRTPAQGFTHHVHMVSIGYPGGPSAVGIYVPAQVDDYYRHTFGLKGRHDTDLDKSWFPGDVGPHPPVGTPALWRAAIDSTVFDYDRWTKEMHMDENTLRAIVREEAAAAVKAELDTLADTKAGKRSLRQQIRETFQIVRVGR